MLHFRLEPEDAQDPRPGQDWPRDASEDEEPGGTFRAHRALKWRAGARFGLSGAYVDAPPCWGHGQLA